MEPRDQKFNGLVERSVVIDGEAVVYRHARHLVEDGIAPPTKAEVATLYRAARATDACQPGGPLSISGQELEELRADSHRRFPREG